MAKATVVFPREETFGVNKDIRSNELLTLIKNELDFIASNNVTFDFFAEDTVSYLFDSLYKCSYLSLLSQKEKIFMYNNVDGLGDKYKERFLKSVSKDYLVKANKSIVFKQRSDYSNEIDYKTNVYQTILRKIRLTAGLVLKDCKFVVYFDRNNQYCSVPEIEYGKSGLLLWKYNLNTSKREITYGGISIDNIDVVLNIIESRC